MSCLDLSCRINFSPNHPRHCRVGRLDHGLLHRYHRSLHLLGVEINLFKHGLDHSILFDYSHSHHLSFPPPQESIL